MFRLLLGAMPALTVPSIHQQEWSSSSSTHFFVCSSFLPVALLVAFASSLKVPTVSSRRDALTMAGMGAAALAFAPQQALAGIEGAVSVKGATPLWGGRPKKGKGFGQSNGCDVLKPCKTGASLWGPTAGVGAQAPAPKK